MKISGLGLRTIKTAVAVGLCVALAELVQFEQPPLFACIAAIICMQETAEKSLVSGRNRLVGTGIGGVVGVAFVSLLDYFPAPFWKILFISLGIVVGFVICNLLKKKDSCSICGVVILAVMIGNPAASKYLYIVDRLGETFVGVVIAIAVNTLLFARRSRAAEGSEGKAS